MAIEKTQYPCTFDDPYGEGPKMKAPAPPVGAVNLPHITPAPLTAGHAPQPHVVRMMGEVQEVVTRYRNLAGFVETKTFKELPVMKQRLMFEQLDQMQAYAKTLSLRYYMEFLEITPVRE